MAMVLEQGDPIALIEHRETVAAHLQTMAFLQSVQRREDAPIETFVGHYASTAAYDAAERLFCEWAEPTGNDANMALDQARALWAVGQILQRPDHPASQHARQKIDLFMDRAFHKVAQASEIGHRAVQIHIAPPADLPVAVEVEATAPVRLDLSGGWSDTPPYCFERGGHVVNVAIDLAGKPPVRAVVRTLDEPVLRLESHDLGRLVELPMLDHQPVSADVRDAFALHKIALDMVGLLRASVASAGGKAGLHVMTECRVPKGSGLGTSSILAATLLAALHKLCGRDATTGELIEQTLLLEQRLSTGGGWQDQIGGIVGGVKSTVTAPGIPQRPLVETLAMSDAQYQGLQERLVVYYSGQQRLARDILRRVEGRWLGREPAVKLLKDQLRESAAAMRAGLLRGRWAVVAREIDRYWRLKKELYPGSTTPTIDVLLLELRDHYIAAGMAGAGGGGFAYFLCRSARQAERLRQLLAERSARPGSLGAVYETQIDRVGLRVSVTRQTTSAERPRVASRRRQPIVV
jgi:galactokinase/mevalonate kinase-like predicted kinase